MAFSSKSLFTTKPIVIKIDLLVMAEDFRMMPMSSRVAQGDTAVLKCLAPRLEIILKMMMRVVMMGLRI